MDSLASTPQEGVDAAAKNRKQVWDIAGSYIQETEGRQASRDEGVLKWESGGDTASFEPANAITASQTRASHIAPASALPFSALVSTFSPSGRASSETWGFRTAIPAKRAYETATTSGSTSSPSKGPSAGAIAGTVIGIIVGLTLIVGLLLYFLRFKRRHSAPQDVEFEMQSQLKGGMGGEQPEPPDLKQEPAGHQPAPDPSRSGKKRGSRTAVHSKPELPGTPTAAEPGALSTWDGGQPSRS